MDQLDEKQKVFFANCTSKRLKGPDREEEYEQLRQEYQKVIEDASEKVALAEDSYSLVDKYMRKLDQELLKFKLELEADNRGITEILEKHALEMDQPSSSSSTNPMMALMSGGVGSGGGSGVGGGGGFGSIGLMGSHYQNSHKENRHPKKHVKAVSCRPRIRRVAFSVYWRRVSSNLSGRFSYRDVKGIMATTTITTATTIIMVITTATSTATRAL